MINKYVLFGLLLANTSMASEEVIMKRGQRRAPRPIQRNRATAPEALWAGFKSEAAWRQHLVTQVALYDVDVMRYGNESEKQKFRRFCESMKMLPVGLPKPPKCRGK